jgi:glycosyltransferase involved in cell wall biosynthesis
LQRGWIRPAQEATVQACSRSRPDVIWATGPPWSSFLVAQQVHRRTGIPYVLDFRTSWTLVPDSFEAMRPMWAQQRDRRRLRQLFREARAVVFFYPAEAECFWRAYRGALDASRIHTIPNGFDGEVEECDLPQNDKFTLAYTGTLSDYRYDTFLEALTILRDRSPGRAQQLIVRFVGEGTDSLADAAHRLGLSHLVSTSPPISHAAIHRLQREADALLMLERKPTLKGHELLAGAKLFDYLRAGRPILGVVPDGEAARVLREVGVSTLASPGAPEEICAVLETLLEAWSAGRLASLVPTRSACERYSGTGQAAALARALEGRPALVPFVPGTFDIVPSLMADLAAGEWA